MPKKQRDSKLLCVIPQKPLLPTKEEDNKDKGKEEDNNVQEVSANKFSSLSSYKLNILKRAINTANSNLYKDINPNSYINYILQSKRCIYAKGVSSKQAPTSYIKYKSYSNQSVSYYRVSLYF